MGKCRGMARYEYKVVAAPKKAKPFKGLRAHEDRFAEALAELMNEMAARDWEYLRAESLPCEERSGLTGRVESYQSVLIFRRRLEAGQKFFEVPPTRQIELHQVAEDRSEHETPPEGGASVTALAPEGGPEPESPSPAGVLGILRNRKARLAREEAESYPEQMKLAGE